MLTFEYITAKRSITFSEDSDFWITSIDSLSSNNINISETQGVGQIGSTRSAQSVQPKDITISGTLFGDLKSNRRELIACISPLVPARFVIHEDGESWYLEGTPNAHRLCLKRRYSRISSLSFIARIRTGARSMSKTPF